MEKKMLEIDEKTPLMFLAGPMFIEMLLNILINSVDTVMLSGYSENAVGAVQNANQVMFLMIIMFNIIATSTSIVVAQYLGAKKYGKMNTIYTLAMVVNLIMGIVLSAGFVLLKRYIMTMLKVPDVMMEDCMKYITFVGGSLFLQACYNVMLQILRCNGHTKIGMYISVAVNILNVGGNFLFLYGPLAYLNLGVVGVAIPTVVARTVAFIVAMIFFYYKKIGKLSLKYITPFPFKLLKDMVKIGIPSAGENLLYNIYQLVLLSFINSMGEDATKAKAFTSTLVSFSMVFSNTAAMATQIITGHLVGAGKEDAAYKRVFSTLKVSMPITIGLSVANWLASPITLRIFTDNETIIHLGFYIMAVDIVIEIGRCLNMTFVNSLKAAGDYMFPVIVGVITMWLLGAGVGYLMGVVAGIGVAGVFMGTASDEFIRGLIVMNRWRQKKWLGKALVSKDRNKIEIED